MKQSKIPLERSKQRASNFPAQQQKQSEKTFNFTDNRPLHAAQLKSQEMMTQQMVSPVIQNQSHSGGCGCPACCGSNVQETNDDTAQQVAIQLKCKECKRSSGHTSKCSRNKNRQKTKAKKVKVARQENASWINLCCYDAVWAKSNNITESMVKKFVSTYQHKRIHGHCSSKSDKDAARHKNTSRDIAAFHGWFNSQ